MAQGHGTYRDRTMFWLVIDANERAGSVNTTNNTSIVDYHMYAYDTTGTYESWTATAGAWSMHIHGQNFSGSAALDFRGGGVGQVISLKTGSLTVSHDADGDATVGFYGAHTMGAPFGPASVATTLLTLTHIWRPPTTDSTYYAQLITSSSARTANIIADAHGGTLNNVQVELNTVASATGATTFTSGSWVDCDMTGLSPKVLYYFRVRISTSQYGWGTWGSWKSFTTLANIPTIGTAYTAGSITRNSAIISGFNVLDNGGEAPSDIRIQYNTTASATGASVVTNGSWNPVTVSGLAALTTYYYRAAAYNSAGWSAYPATWKSFTTLSDAPDDMGAPVFTLVDDDSMTATWAAPNMNGATFVNYGYQVSLSDTFVALVTSGTSATPVISLSGLIAGTRYYCRMRANATPNNGGYGGGAQATTGFTPNSGLRAYICVDGTIYPAEVYTFVAGVRKKLVTMYAHDGVLETE